MISLGGKQLDNKFRLLEDNFRQQEEDHDNLQNIVKNVDNNLRRNNLILNGLKEGVEGDSLNVFLENMFTGCLGSDSNIDIKLRYICISDREI